MNLRNKLFGKKEQKAEEIPLEELLSQVETLEGKAHFLFKLGKSISSLDKKYIDETVNLLSKRKSYGSFNMQATILSNYGLIDEAKKKVDSYIKFRRKQLLSKSPMDRFLDFGPSSPFSGSGVELYYYESLPKPDYKSAAEIAKREGLEEQSKIYYEKAMEESFKELEEIKKGKGTFDDEKTNLYYFFEGLGDFAKHFDKEASFDYYKKSWGFNPYGRKGEESIQKIYDFGEDSLFTNRVIDFLNKEGFFYKAFKIADSKNMESKKQKLIQQRLHELESDLNWDAAIHFSKEQELNNKVPFYLEKFLEQNESQKNYDSCFLYAKSYGTLEQREFYRKKALENFELHELKRLEKQGDFNGIGSKYSRLEEHRKAVPFFERLGYFSHLASMGKEHNIPELQKYAEILKRIEE